MCPICVQALDTMTPQSAYQIHHVHATGLHHGFHMLHTLGQPTVADVRLICILGAVLVTPLCTSTKWLLR